jgi:hypothetical protein
MTSSSFQLKSLSRCLCAHAGDEERHAFLAATANIRGPNEVRFRVRWQRRQSASSARSPPLSLRARVQIRLLRYHEASEELECAAVYAPAAGGRPLGAVSGLSACPSDPSLVLALSGISGPADVARYRAAGVQGVLVGEALMRAPDQSLVKANVAAVHMSSSDFLENRRQESQARYERYKAHSLEVLERRDEEMARRFAELAASISLRFGQHAASAAMRRNHEVWLRQAAWLSVVGAVVPASRMGAALAGRRRLRRRHQVTISP